MVCLLRSQRCCLSWGFPFDLGLHDRFHSMTLQTEAGVSLKSFRVSWYRGFVLGLSGFVRPVAEYRGLLLLGASATQLSKLDCMQWFAEQLCSSSFVPLSRRHHAAALGLLCKLLDGTCREHWQMFRPAFLSSVSSLQRSQCLNFPQPYLLINPNTATSLDLFHRSFLGCIADIWNNVQLDHIQSSVYQSWTVLLRKMQNVICTV